MTEYEVTYTCTPTVRVTIEADDYDEAYALAGGLNLSDYPYELDWMIESVSPEPE